MNSIEHEAYSFGWKIIDFRVLVYEHWSRVDTDGVGEMLGDLRPEYLGLLLSVSRLAKRLALKREENIRLAERLKHDLKTAWDSVERATGDHRSLRDGACEDFGLASPVVESPLKNLVWNQLVASAREFCSSLRVPLDNLGILGLSLSLVGTGGSFYGGDFATQAALLVPDRDWLMRALHELRTTHGLEKLNPYPEDDTFDLIPADLEWADTNHDILLAHFQGLPYEPDPDDTSDLPWDEVTELRNRWIYCEVCNGTAHRAIINALKTKPKDWEGITTPGGINAVADRYAKVPELPPPPKRKSGRPSKRGQSPPGA